MKKVLTAIICVLAAAAAGAGIWLAAERISGAEKDAPAPSASIAAQGAAEPAPEESTEAAIPFAAAVPEDIERITYNDDSVPPGDVAAEYTDKGEIQKILDMLHALQPMTAEESAKTDPAETEPGNHCSYTVYFADGSSGRIDRSGSVVTWNGAHYKGRLYRQMHKDEAEIYISDSIGMPAGMKLEQSIGVYDAENTLVSSLPVIKYMDEGDWAWREIERLAEAEMIPAAELPGYLDLSQYGGVHCGDYKAEYTAAFPSGETETVTSPFTIFDY